jgi:hypothetical protein
VTVPDKPQQVQPKTAYGLDLAGFGGGTSALAKAERKQKNGAVVVTVYTKHVWNQKVTGVHLANQVLAREKAAIEWCTNQGCLVVDTPLDVDELSQRLVPGGADSVRYIWELTQRHVDKALGGLTPFADRIGHVVARFQASAGTNLNYWLNHKKLLETYPKQILKDLDAKSEEYKGVVKVEEGEWEPLAVDKLKDDCLKNILNILRARPEAEDNEGAHPWNEQTQTRLKELKLTFKDGWQPCGIQGDDVADDQEACNLLAKLANHINWSNNNHSVNAPVVLTLNAVGSKRVGRTHYTNGEWGVDEESNSSGSALGKALKGNLDRLKIKPGEKLDYLTHDEFDAVLCALVGVAETDELQEIDESFLADKLSDFDQIGRPLRVPKGFRLLKKTIANVTIIRKLKPENVALRQPAQQPD